MAHHSRNLFLVLLGRQWLLLLLLLSCLFQAGAADDVAVADQLDGAETSTGRVVVRRIQFVLRRKRSSGLSLRELNDTYVPRLLGELQSQARRSHLARCADSERSDSGGGGVCVLFRVDYPKAAEWSELRVAALLLRPPASQPGPGELRAFANLADSRLRSVEGLDSHFKVTAFWRTGGDNGAWLSDSGNDGRGAGGSGGAGGPRLLRAVLPVTAAAAAALALVGLLVRHLQRVDTASTWAEDGSVDAGTVRSDGDSDSEEPPSRPIRFRGNSDRQFVDAADAAAKFASLLGPPPIAASTATGPAFHTVASLEPWWPDGFVLAAADAEPAALLAGLWDANCTVVCSLRPAATGLGDPDCGGEGQFRVWGLRASCHPSHTARSLSLACLDTNLMRRLTLCSFTAAWDPAVNLPLGRANFVRFGVACAAALAAAPASARAAFVGPGPGLAGAALLPAFLAAAAEVRRSRSCDLLRLVGRLRRRCPAAAAADLGPRQYVFLLECLHLYAYLLRQSVL